VAVTELAGSVKTKSRLVPIVEKEACQPVCGVELTDGSIFDDLG
jgi:hypothetical protein